MAEFKLSYTASEINTRLGRIDNLAEKSELPTKTSDLANDSDFTTKDYVQGYAQPKGNYALKSEIPDVDLSDYALKSDIPSVEGLATESYVGTQIASLVNSAPETLNTLDELAAALGDDANFATTVTNQIASKLNTSELPTAINTALAQAKASGEFDGKDGTNGTNGKDGKTPVRGTDYWTASDIAEIKSYVDDAILGGAW